MKVLILAGGRGSRLNEITDKLNKCMSVVNGKPVIEYSLDNAVKLNPKEVIIVVGYRAEDIINTIGTEYRGTRIRYVIQKEQKGLVNAMECAEPFLRGEDFFMMLGDEIMMNTRHQAMIENHRKNKAFASLGVLEVENKELIKRTYALVANEGNKVYRIIEKPRNPLNKIMGTGNCCFNSEIFQYIKFTPIHHERNEKELPDLVQVAIDDGKDVFAYDICDMYTNINTTEDIKYAESFE